VPKNWLKTWDEYKGEMDRKRLYWEDYNKNGKAYNFLETNVTQLKEAGGVISFSTDAFKTRGVRVGSF
jgi:hypothetical protein